MKNLEILFEDNHLIIVSKKCGDIVQGDRTGDKTLADDVKAYLKTKYNKPGAVFLGITHRIDRPTSGIIIFARTSKALTRINKMFLDKKIKKTYLAVVSPKPKVKSATLHHFLIRNTKQNKSYASEIEKKGSKEAILTYQLIAEATKYSLLKIDLQTGRHHQIRAQFAAENIIIKGDLKYGAARSNENAGIHLHAYSVEFTHPITKELIKIKAPLPKDSLWDFFASKL